MGRFDGDNTWEGEVAWRGGWPSVARRGTEKSPSRTATETEQGLFWAFIRLLVVVFSGCPSLKRCWGTWGEQVVAVDGQESGQKSPWKPAENRIVVGGDNGGWSWEGFWRVFETLTSSIKIMHELGFIRETASFQLVQKSGNLVMLWLPKNALKLH